MPFDPTLAAIRFGTGLSPLYPLAASPSDLLRDLSGPDLMDQTIDLPSFDAIDPSLAALQRANKLRRDTRNTDQAEDAEIHYRDIRRAAARAHITGQSGTIARALGSPFGLRERLVAFWADHFTVKARAFIQTHLVTPYVEDAIRPHITGRFGDMLKAVVQHPMMLTYLEQWRSTGPNSLMGQRTGRGLNENLARELLELHLLGVSGSYSQADVTEFAELLTGMVYHSQRGVYYNPRMAEPGAEQVMGLRFGAEDSLATVLDALETLALLPETARHLARKMAVHFVHADPDPALIIAMADSYLATGGNLMAMTAAMLEHDSAWIAEKTKVRLPQEFMIAAARALGMGANDILTMEERVFRNVFRTPLTVMGQPFQRPIGPDGWSEDPEDWIIPQAMAGRISWAMRAPRRLVDPLPDPRDFVITALGDHAPQPVIFAAGAAETQHEGVGIVLASAAFQRR